MNSVEIIKQLGINAKKAAAELANIHNEQKNKALYNLKENLIKFSSEIIQINNKDIENAKRYINQIQEEVSIIDENDKKNHEEKKISKGENDKK